MIKDFKKWHNKKEFIHITKTNKIGEYYFKFSFEPNMQSVAILSQLRLIDVKRFKYKIGDIHEDDFKVLKEKLKTLLP